MTSNRGLWCSGTSQPDNIHTRSPNVNGVRDLGHSLANRERLILDHINADQEAVRQMRYIQLDRDMSLPLENHKVLDKYTDSQDDDITLCKYLIFGIQKASHVTENLLSHPFIVLRRQCQIYNDSQHYHIHPFRLLPSIVHLESRQGMTSLWKGFGSSLLVRSMPLLIDDVIFKLTSWPKEVTHRTDLKCYGQHVLLKCISMGLMLPFDTGALVSTVQSDIVSEKQEFFNVFRKGILGTFFCSYPLKDRMLPTLALFGPSVTIGITKYFFQLVIHGVSLRIVRRRLNLAQLKSGTKFRDETLEHQNEEIHANLITMLTTEVIFYPFETILHRLQVQGTCTIIDNLDNGYEVVPILTNYRGAFDCFRTTVASEGFSGLYKGFGALVLQFLAHLAIINLSKWAIVKVTDVINNRPHARIIQYYNRDRDVTRYESTTGSPSISSVELDDLDAKSIGEISLD